MFFSLCFFTGLLWDQRQRPVLQCGAQRSRIDTSCAATAAAATATTTATATELGNQCPGLVFWFPGNVPTDAGAAAATAKEAPEHPGRCGRGHCVAHDHVKLQLEQHGLSQYAQPAHTAAAATPGRDPRYHVPCTAAYAAYAANAANAANATDATYAAYTDVHVHDSAAVPSVSGAHVHTADASADASADVPDLDVQHISCSVNVSLVCCPAAAAATATATAASTPCVKAPPAADAPDVDVQHISCSVNISVFCCPVTATATAASPPCDQASPAAEPCSLADIHV